MIVTIVSGVWQAETEDDWQILLEQKDQMPAGMTVTFDEINRTMTINGDSHVE